VPGLVHGERKLSQSGVILTYLADHSGKFRPETEDDRLEALRWIIFDNPEGQRLLGPYRFLRFLAKPAGDPAVLAFLKGRIDNNLAIVDKRLSALPSSWGRGRPSPIFRWLPISTTRRRKFGFDIAAEHKKHRGMARPHQGAAGWKHPYELMPGPSAAAA